MKNRRTWRGLTLVELLAVIAIVAILAALLLAGLARAKDNAERKLCASNLRQWGVALAAFANDNDNCFPDNRDGAAVSWCGTNVQAFWTHYLVPLVRTRAEINQEFHVLFCPTAKWHRGADLLPPHPNDYGTQVAVGYFYLPYRDPAFAMNVSHRSDFNVTGVQGWVEKQRLGGPLTKAPIAMDEKQAIGDIASDPTAMQWFGVYGLGDAPDARTPFSSHIQSSGEPFGGNFLFEDAHVSWHKTRQIEPAMTLDHWVAYYKIPVE
jgi:prepilin-type N-terminal cleavage/methylation domain-containing protein